MVGANEVKSNFERLFDRSRRGYYFVADDARRVTRSPNECKIIEKKHGPYQNRS